MKMTKRILSFVLCLAMIVGIIPMSVFAADEVVLDAAIFCSDVHGSTSDLSSVLAGVKTSGVDYSSIGFVGDTCLTVANTTSTVQSALGDTDIAVMFSYAASHDTEDGADISTNWNYSGEVEGVSDYYLVYTIRETDMQNDNGAEENFTSWYSGLTAAQKQLPIFIMSHRPLHARRNDNAGAASWYDAISAAAESSDIVFFWGHNHTGENSTDTNAYYVAKDGTETISVQGGSTVTPNFTYMNAGYINANGQNPARKGVATTVKITADSLIFQDYNSSGEYSGTYAHNVTVKREFASSKVLKSVSVSGKTRYTIGDNGLELTATATYDDGTTADVTANTTFTGYDLTKSGVYTVTVAYGDWSGEVDITVAAHGENESGTITFVTEVVSTGVTAVKIENVWGEPDLSSAFEDYVAYNITLENYTEGNAIEYTMSIVEDMDLTNLALYHVSTDGTNVTLTPIEFKIEGDCIVFTYDQTGTFAYGSVKVPDGYVLDSISASNYETDYFVDETLDLTNSFTVTAIYKKVNSDDFIRVISVYEENNNPDGYTVDLDSFDMTTAGTYNVKLSYTYEDVTCDTTFSINVWDKEFTGSNVTVTVGNHGVSSMEMSDVSDSDQVKAAVGSLLNTYNAYDIDPALAEGYVMDGTATVKMPAPDGADVVYYFNETTGGLEKMTDAEFADGYVTFTTDHFSIYVVGDTAEEDEKTLTLGSDETKTVYVLVSTPTAGNQYIIVSSGSAGTGYALKENTTTGTSVTINAVGNGVSAPYIVTSDETIMWNATSGLRFQSENDGYYVYYSSSNSGSGKPGGGGSSYTLSFSTSSPSNTWTAGTNALYRNGQNNDYYLRCNGGTWAMGGSNSTYNVYFYEKQTVTVSTKTEYEVSAEDIEHIYSYTTDSEGNTTTTVDLTIGETLAYKLLANGEEVSFDGEVWTIAVVSDANGIIDKDKSTNETLYFTGNAGEAKLRVYYQLDANGDGDVTDDDDYKVWTTFTVTATYPYYTVDITHDTDDDGVTEDTSDYTSVEDTIMIKGETEINAGYDLWAKVYLNGTGDPITVQSEDLTWSSNNTAVATVDGDGNVTFTGSDGTAQITVYYEYTDNTGNKVKATDVVTFSVTQNPYIVPEDGTNDFPEYPNQGAIRFDKTATAVGNFSQTGMAMIELSMTGRPYGTNVKTDVVIMVDMTASMSDDDVTAAEAAVKELLKSLVYDEENDKYDSNIQLFVDVFYSASSDSSFSTEEYLNNVTISSDAELTAAQNLIDFTQSSNGGGTRYNLAMKDVYETLNRDGHADNQFVVFVSDGVATAYAPLTDGALGTTITGSNSETASLAAGWFDNTGAVTDEFETEYYSYMIKTAGIPVYTVGCNLTTLSDAADVLNHMSSNYSPDGKTSTGETKYSFMTTTENGITDETLAIFKGIGADIKEAATDVVVEDKVDSSYSVNFTLPSGVTKDEAGMEEFFIQILDYTLDDTTHERTGEYKVIENFTFNADGTLKSHTVDGIVTCDSDDTTTDIGTCSHVTFDDNGEVTAINGTYFTYKKTADGEILTWEAAKISTTELALQYFVYLENSAGDVDASDQKEAGVYYTNEYAKLTYTNFQGNKVQQTFPVPQMTWKGAQVTYVFYLVNASGQPVNRAGKVVPFAEAIYVTDPVTYDVTWNEATGVENILAHNLFANAKVPDVYQLYDDAASYVIRVYQTENVDTNGVNGNYFQISGSENLGNTSTTKVFNTKAGIKYDQYGIYSVYDKGTILTDGTNNITTTIQAKDIDYAYTTVAFAVVWKPELVEDTVVIDFGLDVVIDVYTNDGLAAGVTGVMLDKPSNIEMNSGSYATAAGTTFIASEDGIWSASVESLKTIRFHLNSMELNAPAVFYYEAGVNYYTYDAAGNATLNTTNMYSKVTVIPATTVYYEDSFVTLESYTVEYDENGVPTSTKDNTSQWTTDGTNINGTQAQDRPGESQISAALDADNNYGADAAYKNMSTHSMGSAAKISVTENIRGEATFTFYGTGFDVISMTSNTTGTLIVQLYSGAEATGTAVKSLVVDTYYGMNTDGTISVNNSAALYQIPVMKMSGLAYGQYTVKIIASYMNFFNHTSTDGGYDLYLDAIRIYDPTGNQNDTANGAYVQDGEGWPIYQEVRNNVIAAADYEANTLNGVVFIDGIDQTASVSDYISYGPNNELYLASGQAIVFSLDLAAYGNIVDSVYLALKSADGQEVNYVIADASKVTQKSDLTDAEKVVVSTATDMYYDITSLKDSVIVVYNAGEGVLSLTNIKVTFTAAHDDVSDLFYVDYDVVTALMNNLQNVSSGDIEGETGETENAGSKEENIFDPTVTVSYPTKVYAGAEYTVTVVTSNDVKTVNGIEEFAEDADKNRVWTLTYTATNEKREDTLKITASNGEFSKDVEVKVAVILDADISLQLPMFIKTEETYTVTVTTNNNVDSIEVNGTSVTEYTKGDSAQRIWKIAVTAGTANGTETVTVVAYNENKVASEAVTAEVEVKEFAPTVTVECADTVEAGNPVVVTVTTSSSVEAVEVNGILITTYRTESDDRVWVADLDAEKAGELKINTTVYDKDGRSVSVESKTITVTESATSAVSETIRTIIGNFVKTLRGWFGW